MADSQTQIPIIKDQTNINLIQQNVNKVLRSFDSRVVKVEQVTSQSIGLGDILFSALNLSQFQAVHGKTFIAANGQSSVGTAYAAFTGNNTVPNVSVSGTNAYIKVNL